MSPSVCPQLTAALITDRGPSATTPRSCTALDSKSWDLGTWAHWKLLCGLCRPPLLSQASEPSTLFVSHFVAAKSFSGGEGKGREASLIREVLVTLRSGSLLSVNKVTILPGSELIQSTQLLCKAKQLLPYLMHSQNQELEALGIQTCPSSQGKTWIHEACPGHLMANPAWLPLLQAQRRRCV